MKKIIILAVILTLNSCGMLSIIGTAKTIVTVDLDRRTVGVIADDELADLTLESWAIDDEKLDDAHLNFNIYNYNALVTGEVPSAQAKEYLVTTIQIKEPSITRVIDETRIAPASTLLERSAGSIIDGKIKLALNKQEVFNPVHIGYHTENNIAYLWGSVTKREGDKAGIMVAGVSGVEKVVKYFHYIDSIPQKEIDRARQREGREEAERTKAKEKLGVEFKNFRNTEDSQ